MYIDESIIGYYGVMNVLGCIIMMVNLDFCGKMIVKFFIF